MNLNKTYTQAGTYKICGAANRTHSHGRAIYDGTIEVISTGTIGGGSGCSGENTDTTNLYCPGEVLQTTPIATTCNGNQISPTSSASTLPAVPASSPGNNLVCSDEFTI